MTRYGTNTGCHYQSDPLPTHQYRLPSGDVLPRHALLAQLVPTKYIPILEKKIQEIESVSDLDHHALARILANEDSRIMNQLQQPPQVLYRACRALEHKLPPTLAL